MRMVKCQFCGEKFDKDSIDFERTSKGHYHKICFLKFEEEKKAQLGIIPFLVEIYGKDVLNYALINKQVKDFTENKNMTVSGIQGTIYYLINIKKANIDHRFGIAMVAFYYNDARRYFESLKELENLEAFKTPETKEIVIAEPQNKKKTSRIVDLDTLFEEGEI